MKNEYGARLDRNGYAPSIIPGHSSCACFICGRNGTADHLDRHEIFGGSYREKSKRLGLWVHLCHSRCHEGHGGVHDNHSLNLLVKQEGQRCAMEEYGWSVEDFICEFGRNYLD